MRDFAFFDFGEEEKLITIVLVIMMNLPTFSKKRVLSCSAEEYHSHVDANDGLCLACGEWTSGGVEPDASGYPCDGCHEPRVCGAEEALLMGELEVDGEVD